jgi:hypothetical protein
VHGTEDSALSPVMVPCSQACVMNNTGVLFHLKSFLQLQRSVCSGAHCVI